VTDKGLVVDPFSTRPTASLPNCGGWLP